MRISDWSSDVCSSDLEQHPLLEGKVPKRGVMLKRGRKKMLAGHEHDHIVWRIGELVSVILASKRVHMRLHRPAMSLQTGKPPPLVRRRARVLIGLGRHIGVTPKQQIERASSRDGVGKSSENQVYP